MHDRQREYQFHFDQRTVMTRGFLGRGGCTKGGAGPEEVGGGPPRWSAAWRNDADEAAFRLEPTPGACGRMAPVPPPPPAFCG